jgi:predicted phage tail component-like protein
MSITLGDKRPEDFPGLKILIKTQGPAMPEIRSKTMEIAGRHGLIDFGATLGPRQFEIVCAVVSANQHVLQRTLRELAAHLLDGKGRPKTMKLIFDEEPDVFYNVRLSGSIPVDRLFGLGQFTIPMIAYDPYAYLIQEVNEIDADSNIYVDRAMSNDAQYNYHITGPSSITIDNFGTQNVEPMIEIYGEWTSINFELGTDMLVLNDPGDGNTYYIDCANYSAYLDIPNYTPSSKLDKISGTFLSLPPGVNEIAVGGTDLLGVFITFKFRPKFI